MNLETFLIYDHIQIQCHDNPDADALASGFAVLEYFKAHGKDVRFIYSGRNLITKPNLTLMVDRLGIPVAYQKTTDPAAPCNLQIFVDCQPGERNVTLLRNDSPIAVIDHHQTRLENNEMTEIQSQLGSCATVVWKLFQEVGFCVDDASYRALRTALYYGLYSDTCEFKELHHPCDRDAREQLLDAGIDEYIFRELLSNNITPGDMKAVGNALASYHVIDEYRTAVIPVEVNDPNILGITGDFLEQVSGIDLCVSYCKLSDGKYKLSVRSATEKVWANNYLAAICGKDASGGHKTKAGGILATDYDPEETITGLTKRFFDEYPAVTVEEAKKRVSAWGTYRKKPGLRQAIRITDIFPEGTPLMVRELEGDFTVHSSDQWIFVIGTEGEVYYMKEKNFLERYTPCDEQQNFYYQYCPVVKNLLTGKTVRISDQAGIYRTQERIVTAGALINGVRMKASWSDYEYMGGDAGDFLVHENIPEQGHIVKKEIFEKTYERIDDSI